MITPLGRDEKIRKELGYQGPTNFIPWWNKVNILRSKQNTKKVSSATSNQLVYTHIEATTALSKNYISASTFENYYSFCFIRNPWDHVLSQFFELRKDQELQALGLDTFIEGKMLDKFATSCRSIYSD